MARILDGGRMWLRHKAEAGGLVLMAALVLWLALSWPILIGERTFILRDVMTTHLPLKSFGAGELSHGRIPAFNPFWAGGQPYRGNPNALPFYPGNLAYLFLPFWSAFGLHYVGHWLFAFFGMRRLGRELGQSQQGALVAGLAYAGSGYVLTALTFMNLLTVAAWAPWTLAGLARGGRRGTLLAGLACGLMLLGGEPISAALVIPAMGVVACQRSGLRQGLKRAALAGSVGLLVALPQLVATVRILPFSYRGSHGLAAEQAAAASMHPARLLELAWPMPWGWPSDLARFGFWAPAITDGTPYVYSLHIGLIAIVLAILGIRRRRAWALLAVVALFGAWFLGVDADLTAGLTFGLFRYPQKLLLVFTLAASLLAGFGLDRILVLERPTRPWLALAVAGSGLVVALWTWQEQWIGWTREHLASEKSIVLAQTQAGHWLVLATMSTLLALGAAWAARRRSGSGLALVQLLALLQMAPAWVTDERHHYSAAPSLLREIGEPRRVAHAISGFPAWEPSAIYRLEKRDPVVQMRIARADLWPDFGPLDRLEHCVAPDLEGLASPLTVFVNTQLAKEGWSTRIAVLRRLGAAWIVRASRASGPELVPVKLEERFGARTELYRIPAPMAFVDWPRAVQLASSPIAAWLAISRGSVDDRTAITSIPTDHRAGGSAALVSATADRIEVDVQSAGGLLVIRRTYWPLLRARLANGEELQTQPVDLALLGVEVPEGHQRVVVDVSAWPELSAGAIACIVFVAVVVLAWRRD